MLRKTAKRALGLCGAVVVAGSAAATDLTVRVTNLTHGIYFTPLLIAAHPAETSLFTAGEPASASLQAMAEGGDITGLVGDVVALGGIALSNPAEGLLGPGASASASLNTDGTSNMLLSVVGMLLPTNDGFLGLNSVMIPSEPGTYTYNVIAYDAGTEANDEIVNGAGAPGSPGIPADPGGFAGSGGTGVTGIDSNTTVHIHRNNLGDGDGAGGPSDLDNAVHRWLNPVARVVVTVN